MEIGQGCHHQSIGQWRYLFEFFHKLDVLRVMNGLPWTFNNHPLLLHHIQRGEYALRVPLSSLPMWVQVYDIPHGYISEQFGRQIGNFLGKFVEYDKSNSMGAWRNYMRIRVSIDVSLPLKCFKRIHKGEEGSFRITFKYERLSTFCFMCGRIGHAESFCELRYATDGGEVVRGWDISLRALECRFGSG
ncbi:hypothetical protein ACS0TY_006434 [Phlomoides rotata]